MTFKIGDRVLAEPDDAPGVIEEVSTIAKICGYEKAGDKDVMFKVRCDRWIPNFRWMPPGALKPGSIHRRKV